MDRKRVHMFQCLPFAIGIAGGFVLVMIFGNTYTWMMYYASVVIIVACFFVNYTKNHEDLDASAGVRPLFSTAQEHQVDLTHVNLPPSAASEPDLELTSESEALTPSDLPPNYDKVVSMPAEQSPPPYSSVFVFPQTATFQWRSQGGPGPPARPHSP